MEWNFTEPGDITQPQNVRVQPTAEGYLVTWDPPARGEEHVKYYTVRWFKGGSVEVYGRAETSDTYYLGIIKEWFFIRVIYKILIRNELWLKNFINFVCKWSMYITIILTLLIRKTSEIN